MGLPRVRAVLAHRWTPIALAALAVVLTLPSLNTGLVADDYYVQWAFRGSRDYPGIAPSWFDLWHFFDGNPHRTQRFMDLGLPWWTFREVKGAFWRPVTAATHVVDYRLWPDHPALMHAQSLLWYGLLVACATLLYRRVMGPTWVAGLAALLYAVDDAHGMPVGMLANRNAILATLFGILALLAHDRWRKDGWRPGAVLGPALLGASLLSAEAGIATCAYLLAYALVLDGGSRRGRFASSLPYLIVVGVWQVVWRALGYGVYGVEDLYNPPTADVLGFLALIARRAPLYLLGQWALPPAETHVLLGLTGNLWLWAGAVAVVIVLAVLLYPLCRRDRTARFWGAGMLFALVPACMTAPMNRQLFFVGLGAMALLAQFLQRVFSPDPSPPRRSPGRIALVCVAWVFVAIHLVIAPIGLAVFSKYPLGPQSLFRAFHTVPGLDPSVAQRDLVIVNHPLPVDTLYILVARAATSQPVPRHTWVLSSSRSPVQIRRPNERTLLVRPAAGFLASPFDRAFRNPWHPMSLGEQVKLTGMTVTVTEMTADKRPAEARFEFSVPLESPSLLWVQWKDGAFRPFTPPGVGQTLTLPAAKLRI